MYTFSNEGQTPFDEDASPFPQLEDPHTQDECRINLTGHPRVMLNDHVRLFEFLEQEFCSPDMEGMSRYLWLMSLQSHANISPLHRQRLKGRQIVVTEDPKLHLVWIDNRIFLKPLPKYLCVYEFWRTVLHHDCKEQMIRMAALGYLRTWFYLIRHESDFRIAQSSDLQLVPQGMSWYNFCRLSARLNDINNTEVCERYRYGEIRLARLNFYAKIILRKWSYQRVHNQYGDYFARFYGPLLFIFAIISVVLSAMQVVMSVEQVAPTQWTFFWSVSRWSAVLCIIMAVVVTAALFALLCFKLYSEWRRAIGDRFCRPRRLRAPQQNRDDVERQETNAPPDFPTVTKGKE